MKAKQGKQIFYFYHNERFDQTRMWHSTSSAIKTTELLSGEIRQFIFWDLQNVFDARKATQSRARRCGFCEY
jgi:hypothetical protein